MGQTSGIKGFWNISYMLYFSLKLKLHLKLVLLSCQLSSEEGRAHELNLSLTGKRRVGREYLRCSILMLYTSTQLSWVFHWEERDIDYDHNLELSFLVALLIFL